MKDENIPIMLQWGKYTGPTEPNKNGATLKTGTTGCYGRIPTQYGPLAGLVAFWPDDQGRHPENEQGPFIGHPDDFEDMGLPSAAAFGTYFRKAMMNKPVWYYEIVVESINATQQMELGPVHIKARYTATRKLDSGIMHRVVRYWTSQGWYA